MNDKTEMDNVVAAIKRRYKDEQVIDKFCDDFAKQNFSGNELLLFSNILEEVDFVHFENLFLKFLLKKTAPAPPLNPSSPLHSSSEMTSVVFSDIQLKFLRRGLGKWKVGDHMLMESLGMMMERKGKVADMFVQAETLRLLVEWEKFVTATALKFDPSPKLHVVGTAGIGKSGLAFIALARSLALGLKVCLFFDKAPARILALDDGGRLFVEKVPLLSDLHMRGLDRSKLVAIFDSRSSYRDEFTLTDGCFQGVLIVQSPSADFSGLHKVDSLVNEVMTAPSFKEIVAMNRDCAYDIPNDELSKRFDMWGPSLRHIFRDPERTALIVNSSVEKLATLPINEIEKSIVAHGLLMMNRDRTFDFLSPYISSLYFEKANLRSQEERRAFILLPNSFPALKGRELELVIRYAFGEHQELEFVRLTAEGLRMCDSFRSKVRPCEFIITRSVRVFHHDFSDLPDRLEVGCLYCPISRRQESIDGLLALNEKTLVFFQITVSPTHRVNIEPLITLYKKFNRMEKFILAFVVHPTSILTVPQKIVQKEPLANPTTNPTANPTADPTADPTGNPTANPTAIPPDFVLTQEIWCPKYENRKVFWKSLPDELAPPIEPAPPIELAPSIEPAPPFLPPKRNISKKPAPPIKPAPPLLPPKRKNSKRK